MNRVLRALLFALLVRLLGGVPVVQRCKSHCTDLCVNIQSPLTECSGCPDDAKYNCRPGVPGWEPARRSVTRCDIDTIDGRELSIDEFFKRYEDKHPVKITHLMTDWPAMDWDETTFIKRFGTARVAEKHARQLMDPQNKHRSLSLEEFVRRGNEDAGQDPVLYVEGLNVWGGIFRSYTVPKFWADMNNNPVLSLMGREWGAPWAAHDPTWIGLIRGRKHWVLAAPGEDRGFEGSRPLPTPLCTEEGTTGIHGEAWADHGALYCTQEQGEVVYFPENWWHATCNPLNNWTVALGGQGYEQWPEIQGFEDANRAAALRNLPALQSLLANISDLSDKWGAPFGKTHPLHKATQNGDLPMVKFLL